MNQKDIKLIALDMDGTLLNRASRLTERTKSTLERAIAKGVHVVIATGRVFHAFPEDIFKVKGIEYAASSNGARVMRLSDQASIYTNLISREKAEELKPYIFQDDLFLEIFFDGNVYVEKGCVDRLEQYHLPARYTEYMLRTRTRIEDLKKAMEDHMDGLENININFGSPERKKELGTILYSMEGITATSSFPHNIEIGGATTSKADGVAHLCEILKVDPSQVMACGDNFNDVKMFQFAGLSVAVDNAEDDVKKQVDFVTKSNEEDGVAFAIEKFVL
ncbi:MAG: Cof-type HAD-IIB family hydrolase [Anaerovorax sp.]